MTKNLRLTTKMVWCALLSVMGFFAHAQTPDPNGIVYVTPTGTGNGSSWATATSNVQGAINATGAQKVFVAVGNYNVGTLSYKMKNGVAIYGGFDPANNILGLNDARILPNEGLSEGSVLNGQNTRSVILNTDNTLDSTAILDGFTIKNGDFGGINGSGGGIKNINSSPSLRNLVIKNNSATLFGGGIYNESSSPKITNCIFYGNTSGNSGGGLFNISNSSPLLTNCIFTGNSSGTAGSAIDNISGNGTFINVTLVNNGNNGLSATGYTYWRNCIIWDAVSGNSYNANYCLIKGATSTANGNLDATGFSDTDIFTNPAAGDYTLKSSSPAIGAGSNTSYPGLGSTSKDIAGNARVYQYAAGGVIDLGAYESVYAGAISPDINGIIYVREGFVGNGKSWINATGNLQAAINTTGVEKVFTAIGNYNVGTGSFVMKNGVKIYGGFDPANGIDSLNDNRVLPNKGMGDGSVLNGQNIKPVVYNNNNGLDTSALLDGFTLMNGNGNNGGALYNYNVSPVFNNLVIKNNTAVTSGGGIYNINAPITLSNALVQNNTALYGGGIRNNNSASQFTNVSINHNSATLSTAGSGGGGVFNELSNLILTNVLIADNTTNFQGGGFRNLSGNPVFTNVTMANNTATDGSNTAMDNIPGGVPILNNSIILGSISGPYIPFASLIQGDTSLANGNLNSTGITSTDVFVNPSAGNYTLNLESPAVNAGNNALYTGLNANTKDLAGNARVYHYANGGIIDLGAYESTYTPIHPTNNIVYVKPVATGVGDGSSWTNATDDLHNAIQISSVQKVFVAKGNYEVGSSSFVMKNGVEIYGGFDPDNGIDSLNDGRIMPDAGNTQGSVLNGQGVSPVIWNVFTNTTALDNTAVLDGFTVMNGNYTNGGGGIRNVYASPTLSNLVIRDNHTTSYGAGIFNNNNSSPKLINSVVSNNTASNSINNIFGAGISNNNNSNPIIINTTIVNNKLVITANGSMYGAGIYNGGGSAATVYNSIIWGNQKNGDSTVLGADIENIGGTFTLKNSMTQSYTTGNISDNNQVGVSPLFSVTDFKLQPTSPAINGGDNSLFNGLNANTKDLAGNARLYNQTIDIGPYEFFITIVPDVNGIVYVRPTSFGLGNGSDWNNATHLLQEAIDANGTQKVYVAVGNYNVGSSSFIMKNNIAIYGGFDPDSGIVNLNDNRILPNKGIGDGSVLNGLNTRPLIWNDNNGLDSTALLDGFTLMNGKNTLAGAIFNNHVSPTFNNLVIRNNSANISGGGILNQQSPIKLSNTVIRDNTAQYGGGLYNISSSNAVFTNVTFNNNTATYNNPGAGGGAIFNQNSDLKLSNVNITGNNAYLKGGGIRNLSGDLNLTNVTIANNTTVSDAATTAMEVTAGNLQINNSIVYGTIAGAYTRQYSLIEGNTDTTSGNLDATGIALADIFTDPTTGDYSLKEFSPGVNTGNNSLYAGLDANTKDLSGNARVYNYINSGIIDLGALESDFTQIVPADGIVYIKPTASGAKDGSSWNNATDDLHHAIQTEGVQKVFVAIGNYNVGDNSFIMKNGVEIYGGFDPANGIDSLNDNRIMMDNTGVTGSVLNGQGVRPVIWNVFTAASPMDSTAKLDGFTITKGTNNGTGLYDGGAGIRNYYASPTIRNVVFRNNSAYNGGGIFNLFSSSRIIHTIFTGNTATNAGGGMLNYSSSSITMTNAIFIGNTAGNGGGISNRYTGGQTFKNIVIKGNVGTTAGGGLENVSSSSTFINTLIASNEKSLYTSGANPLTFINATIAQNYTSSGEVGIYTVGGNAVFKNTIHFGSINGTGTVTAYHSLIGGYSDTTNGNINATGISESMVFSAPGLLDLTLNPSSPVINKGSNAFFSGLNSNSEDLAGNSRLHGSAIDMGAYEFQGTPLPIKLLSFTAQIQNKTSLLQWATADEQDCQGFDIERSSDGREWSKIGFVNSLAENGNSTQELMYRFVDNQPLAGKNFYHLKQIDFDGNANYSPIRMLIFNRPGQAINIYPNPAKEQITVTGLKGGEMISFFDALGRKVKDVQGKNTDETISVSELNAGMYRIVIKGGNGGEYTMKLAIR